VQLTHTQKHTPIKYIIGIVFTSLTKPKYGVPEEVTWGCDVVLSSTAIVLMQRGGGHASQNTVPDRRG
jgi:hypothetical protein